MVGSLALLGATMMLYIAALLGAGVRDLDDRRVTSCRRCR